MVRGSFQKGQKFPTRCAVIRHSSTLSENLVSVKKSRPSHCISAAFLRSQAKMNVFSKHVLND